MNPLLIILACCALSLACSSNAGMVPPDGAPVDTSAAQDAADDTPMASDIVAADAAADVADDRAAPLDAPECPRPMPLRRAACAVRDQVCIYSCGIVFRCTAIGWDNALDVDAGPPCP